MEKEKVNILLVDDEQIDIMAFKKAFDEAEVIHPLVSSSDPLYALELLRSKEIKPPFVIVLDINMPIMDGFDFLDEIRRDPYLQNSDVFIWTSSLSEDDKARAAEYDVVGYLEKKATVELLSETVKLIDSHCQKTLKSAGH